MQLYIGSTLSSAQITSEFESQFLHAAKRGGMRLLGHNSHYTLIELDNNEAILKTAHILAEIFMDAFQFYFFEKELSLLYPSLKEQSRYQVMLNTVKSLYPDFSQYEYTLSNVMQCISRCMYESTVLSLDGVLFFRIPSVLQDWKSALIASAEDFIAFSEREKQINFLRTYIKEKKPLLPYIRVEEEASEYHLYDKDGSHIFVIYPFELNIEGENELISSLVNLSPSIVNIKNLSDPVLREVILLIFQSRAEC